MQKHFESLARKTDAMMTECRGQLQKEFSEGVGHGVQPLEVASRKLLEQQCESVQRLFDRRLAVAAETYLESLNREGHVIVEKGRSRLRQEVDTAVLAVMPTLEAQHEKRVMGPPEPAMRPMELHTAGPSNPQEAVIPTQDNPGINAAVHAILRAAVRLLPVTPILLFITLSIRPMMYLRTDPPPEFFEGLQDLDSSQRAEEERQARAYWDSAVRHVQMRYEAGTTLPEEPPPDFKVENLRSTSNSPQSDSEARSRYWRKLRQVWKLPQVWQKSYVWDTGWALLQLIGAR
jgi:hypothetical protein